MEEIKSMNDFEEKVVKSTLPVVVDFFAQWCGPCKIIAPLLEDISKDMADKVTIVKVNIDTLPDIAAQYGVQSIPTLIVFKQGKDAVRQVGALAKDALVKWVENNIA